MEVQDGYEWGRLNLNSVTEESSFQEFLRTAELAGTEFQAEKLNLKFVNPKAGVGLLTDSQREEIEQKQADNKDLLKIPRRPKWTRKMDARDLQVAENEVFLDWRRKLALSQEDEQLLLTPYEKNIEFWRQLWRVVERSDVIVQIVDARNPLIYRSEDLEKYVHEVDENKMNVILVNKSDLLTAEQRQHWAEYFDKQNIKTAFFSATLAAAEEQEKDATKGDEHEEIWESPESSDSEEEKSSEENSSESHPSTSENSATLQENEAVKEVEVEIRKEQQESTDQTTQCNGKLEGKNDPKLLSRVELIEFFKNLYKGETYKPEVTTIGLVGYPNVGKSSTINTLMAQKKVSVSATPGKTKHFQTLFLQKDLMLCDCPGLVMPSFVLTKADMILNGILPIDQVCLYDFLFFLL